MSKNVASKNKASYKLMPLMHKEKNYYQEIINITKVFINWCAYFIETPQHRHF